MKAVTVFETSDGCRFDTAERAEQHEAFLAVVADAMHPLGDRFRGRARNDECDFANGSGYIHHGARTVKQVKERLLKLASEKFGRAFTPDQFMLACRYADDNGGPLNRAFGRLMSFDDAGREWGQPYFVFNPGVAKNVCLEDRRRGGA